MDKHGLLLVLQGVRMAHGADPPATMDAAGLAGFNVVFVVEFTVASESNRFDQGWSVMDYSCKSKPMWLMWSFSTSSAIILT